MSTKKKKNTTFSSYLKKLWLLFLSGIGFVILLFVLASWGLLGEMPTFEKLENPESNIATEIISTDGVVIGRFYAENRVPVTYDELPKHLIEALVATEDERFYEHSGIDARGTLRAVVKLGTDGGASTITQQLAKNLFHGSDGSKNIVMRILQKIKEWVIAVRLERQYTKSEIITMYLNQVDFVNNAIGIRSAANIYFNKEPKNLTIEESAVFIGMLTNPSRYNPKRFLERSIKRRNVVLKQMVRSNFLSETKKTELQKKPLVLDFNPQSHDKGIATYFREHLRKHITNWTKNNFKKDGTKYDIYRDGLKIYVTLDSKMQQYAEEAVKEHLTNLQEKFFQQAKRNKNAPFLSLTTKQTDHLMKRLMKSSERWRLMKKEGKSEKEILQSFDKKTTMKVFSWKGSIDTLMTPKDSIRYYQHFLQTGMIAIEPQSGHIKAWVGGINYKNFKYDHAGQGARQVGSTFKPFVYATAIEQLGMSPCDSIIDGPFTMEKGRWGLLKPWSPSNSDGKYKGMVSLRQGLANSLNPVSAKLMDRVGPKAVINLAKNLGISSKIPEQPAIALGAVEVTVKEMVGAFSTFANKGVYIEPTFITRIEDKNGIVLQQFIPKSKDVMNADVAYAITQLLEGVTKFGTGKRLRWGGAGFRNYNYKFTNPIAGKTGTSQNNSDGWFVGIVPNLATGVWVGNDNRAAHFRRTYYGQGATMALPIWGLFMQKCYNNNNLNISKDTFEKPKNLSIQVDCSVKKETDSIQNNVLDLNEFQQ